MNNNPLSNSQREKSGSNTLENYDFQYHWALCKIIDEHQNHNQYAIFMEYHEDVVFADNLDKSHAKFEFIQVKNSTQQKPSPFTVDAMVKRDGDKNSILGKLIQSSQKLETSRLKSVSLVASQGFNIKLKEAELQLEIIKLGDICDESLEVLKNSISSELSTSLPLTINFIKPRLQSLNQYHLVIGKFAELINQLFPNTPTNVTGIYRTLHDELLRKGTCSFDYLDWADALQNKALTSDKVSSVIQVFTSIPDRQNNFDAQLNALLDDLEFKKFEYTKLVNQIRTESISGLPPRKIELCTKINALIDGKTIDEIDQVFQLISSDVDNNFTEKELKAHIIYCFITGAIS